jgi:phosphatidylglycerophosphatase A
MQGRILPPSNKLLIMKFKLIKEKNPVNEEQKVSLLMRAIGSGLFVGYIPFASGTFGSLLGLLIFLIPGFSDFRVLIVGVIVLFVAGIYVSEIMQKRYGEDPPEVIIDEIVGLWFTYLIGYAIFSVFFTAKSFDPQTLFITKLLFGLVGLVIFRIFDILKLQPALYFDNLKNGYGIMMDDISAGLYAGILSPVITHFLWFRFIRYIL